MQGLTVFRSRFFWRLFLSFAAVLAVTGLLVDRLVGQRLELTLTSALEEQLREASALLEPFAREQILDPGRREQAQEAFRELGEASSVRITLIRPDGSVVADSDEEASIMENHGSRPEVLQAKLDGVATSQRFSRTINQRMIYLARSMRRGDEIIGIVRLSIPMEQVEQQLAAARGKLALSLGIGLLFALILGVILARRATAPIVAMTNAAAAIRDGNYNVHVPNLSHKDEFGLLARTLRDLGAEVTRKIATISEDDAQLRAMLAGMIEGVVAVDDEGRVLFCNGAARRLLELDVDPRQRRLLEQAPVAGLDDLIASARADHSAAWREIELHRHGKEVVLNAHASPFQGGGRTGVVVVVHDVSDLRRLENIRRDFVANVSHELKTPLAAIKGFVETLLGGALHDDKNNQRFLERIDANVDRLTHLVIDLLSLARIESTEGSAEPVAMDWREVISGVLHRHRDVAERKGLQLLAPATDPVVVLGDPEAMTQVLENLVDNAVKYTPKGVVEITIDREETFGVLRVRDTGLGIPAVDLERIFERFYRVDKARSHELGGTGLGLSIVKHLVLTMKGEVSVESEPGRGTAFVVKLPLA